MAVDMAGSVEEALAASEAGEEEASEAGGHQGAGNKNFSL